MSPNFKEPEQRATAARILDEALSKSGRGVSEVWVDETWLRWHEIRTLASKRTIVMSRELDLRKVRSVQRPEKDDIGWTLHLDAAGGPLTFRFRDDRNAAAAEVAFRRLMRER